MTDPHHEAQQMSNHKHKPSAARIAATIQLQTPDRCRDPTRLIGQDVCPHCKRATVVHGFTTPDGHWIGTHHCAEHGDVIPMRSHVVNIP